MNSTNKIKIVIVDDHPLFTEGLRLLLKKERNFEITALFNDGRELLEYLNIDNPDIILLDLKMPTMKGEEVLQQALMKNPHLRIIIVTSEEDTTTLEQALNKGAKGFVSKISCKDELFGAINAVYNGGVHFSQDIFEMLIDGIRNISTETKDRNTFTLLTNREKELLTLLCKGKTSKEIASELGINHRTVETHKANMIEKFGVKNTVNLVAHVISNRLVRIE